ncbi:MAG: hypothetical protein WKF83_09990 [Nocardioidaceae bacterium]
MTGAGLIGLLTALLAQGARRRRGRRPRPRPPAADYRREAGDVRRLDGGRSCRAAEDQVAPRSRRPRRRSWCSSAADGRPPLPQRCGSLRPQGTVVDLAFYTGGAEDVRLGDEFHHNGLTVRCAQIGRVPRGLSSSWDRQRLSAETVRLLRHRGADIRSHLMTDVLPLADAPILLNDLAARRRHVLSAVFTVG